MHQRSVRHTCRQNVSDRYHTLNNVQLDLSIYVGQLVIICMTICPSPMASINIVTVVRIINTAVHVYPIYIIYYIYMYINPMAIIPI